MTQQDYYQKERLQSLNHQVSMGMKVLEYLYFSNAGAIVALIGYMSNKQSALPFHWKMAAFFFVCGLTSAIVSPGLAYFFQGKITHLTNNYISKSTDSPSKPQETFFNLSIGCAIFSLALFITGALLILFSF